MLVIWFGRLSSSWKVGIESEGSHRKKCFPKRDEFRVTRWQMTGRIAFSMRLGYPQLRWIGCYGRWLPITACILRQRAFE